MHRIFRALNAHDATAHAAFHRPDAVVHTTASPEPVRGAAPIHEEIQQGFTAMPDMALQSEELIVEGTTAAMRLLPTGAHTGPLPTPAGEVPPTGRRVSVPMAVFTGQEEDGMTGRRGALGGTAVGTVAATRSNCPGPGRVP